MSLHDQPNDFRIFDTKKIWVQYQAVTSSQNAVKKSMPVHDSEVLSSSSREMSVETRGNPISTAAILDFGRSSDMIIPVAFDGGTDGKEE